MASNSNPRAHGGRLVLRGGSRNSWVRSVDPFTALGVAHTGTSDWEKGGISLKDVQYFSENGDSLEKLRADFYIADERRTFSLRVNNGVVYINPKFFMTISGEFKSRFEKMNDECGEMDFEDIPAEDMVLLLQSTCPTMFHLYPVPVCISNVETMILLAARLKMPGFILCCEQVLNDGMETFLNKPDKLFQYFDLSYRCNLTVKTQAKLLYHLLDYRIPQDISDTSILSTETGNIFLIASVKRYRNCFPHAPTSCLLRPSDTHSIKCSRCEEEVNKKNGRRNRRKPRKDATSAAQELELNSLLTPCDRCQKLFCNRCASSVCITGLAEFLLVYPISRIRQMRNEEQ